MKWLFEQELAVQKLWITGNEKITVKYNNNPIKSRSFNTPNSLMEMAFYILLEQLASQNARKMEAAIFALKIMGKRYAPIIDTIVLEWSGFTEVQKDCLLIIITRWVYDGVDLGKMYDTLADEYATCNLLSRKYFIHSIFMLMDKKGQSNKLVYCSAESPTYILPESGPIDMSSIYESFLSLVEENENSSQIANGIRRYISQFSAKEVYVDDEYSETGDIRIPTLNPDVNRILFNEEKHGRWNRIPLLSKKSRLIPPEDPFLLTDMQHIVYDEEWFPNVPSSSHEIKSRQALNAVQLSKIAHQSVSEGEIMLAAYIWYPWGHEEGVVYIETAKVCPAFYPNINNKFDWCLGNFGMLAKEGIIDETISESIFSGGINLFNRIGGKIRICFGNSQLAPSSAWRKLLSCKPSNVSPYVWISEDGDEVLRFERFASPTRTALHEGYVRQPILFRWVCDSDWLARKQKVSDLLLRYITSIEELPR